MPKILVIHGAGMNMRGKVQLDIFGPMTLPEYDDRIRGYAKELGVEVELPVRRGQPLGEVQVLDRGRVIARSPLVAAAAIDRPDRLDRIGFYARRTVHHLGGLLS